MTTTERDTYLDFPGAKALAAAGRVAPPSAHAVNLAVAAVLEAAATEQLDSTFDRSTGTPTAPTAPATAPTRRIFSAKRAAALFALAAVAAGVVVATGTDGTHAPASHPAAARPGADSASGVLDHIASVADAQPAITEKYWRMSIDSVHTPALKGDGPTTMYVSRNGYTIKAGGRTFQKGRPTWAVGSELVDWNGLDKLPTDPAALLKLMSNGSFGRDVAFDDAGRILGEAPASPALRAGLFRALGQLPGVKVVGTVKDSTGRSGTELVYPGPFGQEALIVDPKSSALLETVFRQDGSKLVDTLLSVGPTDTIG